MKESLWRSCGQLVLAALPLILAVPAEAQPEIPPCRFGSSGNGFEAKLFEDPCSLTHRFGVVGLALSEVAQLSATLTEPVAIPAPEPLPCVVTLAFVDADGSLLFNRVGRVTERVVGLFPGQGRWFDLPASEVLREGEVRRMIRPVINASPDNPPGVCAGLVASFELIDRETGRSRYLWAPAPEPVFSGSPITANRR